MAYIYIPYSIFIIILMLIIEINFIQSSDKKYFYILLTESKIRLKKSVEEFSLCVNNNTVRRCMKRNNEIYKFKKITHSHLIMDYKNGLNIYKILIKPKIDINIQNIVIIPVAPTELIARIAVRSTWYSVKQTDKGKKLFYIFYMGKPEMINFSYPLNLIYEESSKYNDILLFDIENSYTKCTLLLLMCYKFVLENIKHLNFLIRVNSDMILYPQKLDKMMNNENGAIGYKTKQMGIDYLSGSFYILRKVYINLILNESKKVVPISFYDDIYCGQINKKCKYNNIRFINNFNYYIPLNDYNQNMLYNKNSSIIGVHSVNSNALLYFWKYRGFKYSI